MMYTTTAYRLAMQHGIYLYSEKLLKAMAEEAIHNERRTSMIYRFPDDSAIEVHSVTKKRGVIHSYKELKENENSN